MSSLTNSQITLSELTFPDITGKVIRAWGLVGFTPGNYVHGGLVMGLLRFADDRSIDFNGFLRCRVFGEDVVTLSPAVGGFRYHYSPVGDVLQIFTPVGVELTTGSMPVQVLNDQVLFLASWNRTTVLG
jgi:hypothetical protein